MLVVVSSGVVRRRERLEGVEVWGGGVEEEFL